MEYHVVKYLVDLGVLSNEWSVNQRVDTDSLSVAVYSESAPQSIDSHHFDYDHVGIQFLVRSANPIEATDKAWEIHRNLSALGYIEISGTLAGLELDPLWINDTHIVNAPTFLSVDDKSRVQFTSHYHIFGSIGNNLYRQIDGTLNPQNLNS